MKLRSLHTVVWQCTVACTCVFCNFDCMYYLFFGYILHYYNSSGVVCHLGGFNCSDATIANVV